MQLNKDILNTDLQGEDKRQYKNDILTQGTRFSIYRLDVIVGSMPGTVYPQGTAIRIIVNAYLADSPVMVKFQLLCAEMKAVYRKIPRRDSPVYIR